MQRRRKPASPGAGRTPCASRTAGLLIVVAAAALLAGCAEDYEPPESTATGRDAAPVGQVLDLDVRLPHLSFPGRPAGAGAQLSVRVDLPPGGDGSHSARFAHLGAEIEGEAVPVEEIFSGEATVTVSGGAWSTGQIGPVSIEGVAFEYALRGQLGDGGWTVSGVSWESQSGLEGAFSGWRRHRFLVAGTDYIAAGRGAMVRLVRESEIGATHELVRTSSDPVLRLSGEAVFVVNRLSFDNVQRLDPGDGFATSWQSRVAAGSNPQDLVALGDGRAYVSRFEPPFDDLAVIDLEERGEVVGSVPLEELAENPDGTPRPESLARAGGVVFAALQDIDRSFTHYEEGKLAVIDPQQDAVVGRIPLPGKNPRRLIPVREADGEKLYVGMAGIFPGLLPQELSGGVAVVDVADRAFERWALDDDAVGGNVVDVAVAGPRLGYALVSDDGFVSRVHAFDPASGEVRREVWRARSFAPGLAIDSAGVLAIPDPSFEDPKLCLYRAPEDPAGTERRLGCASLELPPVDAIALD